MALNDELVKKVFGEKAAYSFTAEPIQDEPEIAMQITNLNISYGRSLTNRFMGLFRRKNRNDHSIHEKPGRHHALKDVTLPVYKNEVLALIGASGCGKSTLLRALNRMNDTIDGCITTGDVTIDGKSIHDKDVEVEHLRRQVGMVAQKPNPFAKSIRENIAYGIRLHGLASNKADIDSKVEEHLTKAGLFNEVKDKLKDNGFELSGGQQQRLCIARTTATEPDILLMDEPCASLDPISTQIIEDRIRELQKHYTIILITHNLAQAARISQRVAHFHMGELVSYGKTEEIFKNEGDEPTAEITQKYVQGAFG